MNDNNSHINSSSRSAKMAIAVLKWRKKMTVDFEFPDKSTFIVKSGNGYFIKFDGNLPCMTNAIILASVFNYYEAIGVLLEFERLGFQAELILEPGK